MPKQIQVRCPPRAARQLAQAIEGFVARNYPQAADECSAAAREVLLDVARRFAGELATGGTCEYSHRVRAFVCEAVKGYCAAREQQEGIGYDHRCDLYIAIVRGQPASESDVEVAEEADRRI